MHAVARLFSVACRARRLQLAAEESGKPRDVDLPHLLACHECACNLVRRLVETEQQPVRMVRAVITVEPCTRIGFISAWPQAVSRESEQPSEYTAGEDKAT